MHFDVSYESTSIPPMPLYKNSRMLRNKEKGDLRGPTEITSCQLSSDLHKRRNDRASGAIGPRARVP